MYVTILAMLNWIVVAIIGGGVSEYIRVNQAVVAHLQSGFHCDLDFQLLLLV